MCVQIRIHGCVKHKSHSAKTYAGCSRTCVKMDVVSQLLVRTSANATVAFGKTKLELV